MKEEMENVNDILKKEDEIVKLDKIEIDEVEEIEIDEIEEIEIDETEEIEIEIDEIEEIEIDDNIELAKEPGINIIIEEKPAEIVTIEEIVTEEYTIEELMDENIQAAVELYNKVIKYDKLAYKLLSEEAFKEYFIDETQYKKYNYIIMSDGKCISFINGIVANETGFITFVAVDPDYRRCGIGREMVKHLEEIERVENISKYEMSFFNPINLDWNIPEYETYDHPNSQGVDVSTPAYIFFKNLFYRDVLCQNTYFKELNDFCYTADIEEKIKSLNERGIEIGYLDKEHHTGLKELFDNLGNELWREGIMNAIDPVLVILDGDKVCGFTGPLRVQSSGRGFFIGIGIHSEYRKLGAGKVLFNALCKGLKDEGATFMTLFTGDNNPARNIYESAKFKIVKSWQVMRKIV